MSEAYRIRRWNEEFENNQSRVLKSLLWVPLPIQLDSDAYTELIDHEDGAAHFGVWIALVQVAARVPKPRRGTLVRESGEPHTPATLARITRMPKAFMEEAIERLVSIGLLETWQVAESQVPDELQNAESQVPDELQHRKEGRKEGRPEGRTTDRKEESAEPPSATAPGDRPKPETIVPLRFAPELYSQEEIKARTFKTKSNA